jgi:hypothetical protein
MLLRALVLTQDIFGPRSRLLPAKSPLAFRDPPASICRGLESHIWGPSPTSSVQIFPVIRLGIERREMVSVL